MIILADPLLASAVREAGRLLRASRTMVGYWVRPARRSAYGSVTFRGGLVSLAAPLPERALLIWRLIRCPPPAARAQLVA